MFGDSKIRAPNSIFQIPPWNPQILNTHKEIWPQIKIMLILDVSWFKNPRPVTENPNPTLKPTNSKHTTKKFGLKLKLC